MSHRSMSTPLFAVSLAMTLAMLARGTATNIAGGSTPTFTILAQGTGTPIPFDPAGRRIFVRFKDSQGATRGSTSVAVKTQ